jgi:hypothetical protein
MRAALILKFHIRDFRPRCFLFELITSFTAFYIRGGCMHFDIFKKRPDAHVRMAQEYLQQANIARIEHQTAAEHHAALATMYAQRVVWLEQELTEAMTSSLLSLRSPAPQAVEAIKRAPESILALARLHRSAENTG